MVLVLVAYLVRNISRQIIKYKYQIKLRNDNYTNYKQLNDFCLPYYTGVLFLRHSYVKDVVRLVKSDVIFLETNPYMARINQ